MRNTFSALTALALIIGASAPARALQNIEALPAPVQNANAPAASLCLTLEQALNLSAQRDPAIAIASAREKEADAELENARSLFRPQVSAFARTGAGNAGLVNSVLQNQFGLSASQRVVDFGDAKFARNAARFDLAAATFDTTQTRLSVARDTGIAYLDILEIRDRMAATDQRVSFFNRQLRSTDILLSQGGATRTERANVAARLAQAEAAKLELQFELRRATTQVEIDTGRKPNICAEQDNVRTLSVSTAALSDKEGVLAIALDRNPNIRALRNRALGEEARQKRERANRFPIVDIVGISALSSVNSIDDLRQQNRIGVDISVPLYSGNAQKARNQRASARFDAADGRVREVERQLTEETSITFDRVGYLRTLVVQRDEVALQNRLRFEAAQIEFDAGTRNLQDFIEARLEYEQAQLSAIQAQYDLSRQQLQLLTLTSSLPIDEL